ncbi:hypothetical protein D6201_06690 [Aurantiacibacter aquimixticola]|uniref:Uncharacterized protein n=2 Tax=Aurantiacibacter aquimixticola TaxID=1958945 RepID=A0A419RTJ0_9SPHN|nr:hypothetical protein D6201_06690 [Aurantiacibacter aquimixticola]
MTGCSDSGLTLEENELLQSARIAVRECHRSICETKFWENGSCAEAQFLLNSPKYGDLLVSNSRSSEDFYILAQLTEKKLNDLYITSLEQELGSTISRPNYCQRDLPMNFPAEKLVAPEIFELGMTRVSD